MNRCWLNYFDLLFMDFLLLAMKLAKFLPMLSVVIQFKSFFLWHFDFNWFFSFLVFNCLACALWMFGVYKTNSKVSNAQVDSKNSTKKKSFFITFFPFFPEQNLVNGNDNHLDCYKFNDFHIFLLKSIFSCWYTSGANHLSLWFNSYNSCSW